MRNNEDIARNAGYIVRSSGQGFFWLTVAEAAADAEPPSGSFSVPEGRTCHPTAASAWADCVKANKLSRQHLPVLFRMWRGEVLALFPTEESSTGLITCYAHVGQHSSACPSLLQDGRPATEAEYAPLLAELRQIYESDNAERHTLKVYKRATGKAQLWGGA